MKRSPYTILSPQTCRLSPHQVRLLEQASSKAGASKTELLRRGALALAAQILDSEPPLA
jgi:uncharacterized protein (DUF1778 family)